MMEQLVHWDLFGEGQKAQARTRKQAGYRPDGAVLLAIGDTEPQPACDLGKLPVKPRQVHYHPRKQDTPDQVLSHIRKLKERYPDCHLHGLSPAWAHKHGFDPKDAQKAGLQSFCWFTGDHPAAQGWTQWQRLDIPKVGTFTYGPAQSVLAHVKEIAAAPGLIALAPLPVSVGDLILLNDQTTDGLCDVSVLTACRLYAEPSVHVRASWAALGWKMAQSTLPFGVDELAGWGLEEFLAYTNRVRPASVVGEEEARLGVEEARRLPVEVHSCAWVC